MIFKTQTDPIDLVLDSLDTLDVKIDITNDLLEKILEQLQK